MSELTIDLSSPGMTSLHRVGLAGLWMTLKALESDPVAVARLQKAGGTWKRTRRSVTLQWEKKAFFDALFKESFRIDKNGLIWFPALGQPIDNKQAAVVLQNAVLGTFLQHGKTRKADPSNKPTGSFAPEIDGVGYPLNFRKVAGYAHQGAMIPLDGSSLSLAGWQYPGGVVRHTGHGQNSTALEEPAERLLSLLYAPVGGIYFEMQHRGEGVRPQFALVIPDVADLEVYARARAVFLKHGVKELKAAGTAEAGLRVLAVLEAEKLLGRDGLGSNTCRVISFGTVPWSTQQKTRVQIFTVQVGSKEVLRAYQVCRQQPDLVPHLAKSKDGKPVLSKDGRPIWATPQVPELVARNLIGGRPWWQGFADYVADRDRRDHIFKYERRGLGNMVDSNEAFPQGPAKTFVRACQQALRNHMGRRFARRQSADWDTEFQKVRVSFARCKSPEALRETIADFWARGGPLDVLKDGWGEVMPFLGERWREGRDLALLALASYKGQQKDSSESDETGESGT
ncbi:MAG: type I-MYXAN CRISPR-associated Cas8a1/Cmx1 [Halobacteria archaeon]